MNQFLRSFTAAAALIAIAALSVAGDAGADDDWPMWRHDSSRSASSTANLPDQMDLLWVRQYSPRVSAWQDPLNRDIMPYDSIFEPVAADGVLVIGFNDSDKIAALDAVDGDVRWTYFTDGPVRLPPAIWKGKVYATSDDGHLYCLDLHSGRLVWNFRGGPNDRRVLGNSRLISMWPARGGVVIEDGTVYFAAGIWPFMGIFMYALDAETGDVVWENDAEGSRYMRQPHNAPSFAGVAPQGSMTVSRDRLLVSGGRSVPACFDRHTGEFLYYELASSGKTGGSFVASWGNYFFNHYREGITTMYSASDGSALLPRIGKYPVLAGDRWYFSGESVTAFDAASFDRGMREPLPAGGNGDDGEDNGMRERAADTIRESLLWSLDVNAGGDLIRAGDRLYAAGDGVIAAVDLGTGSKPSVAWRKTVHGDIGRLVAANGTLFAVTLDGRIMAFGETSSQAARMLDRPAAAGVSDEASERARAVIERTNITDGYALVYGIGDDGAFLEALSSWSDLKIIAFDPDKKRVDTARRRLDERGLYGGRVAVHAGEPFGVSLPPYIFSLTIVTESAEPERLTDAGVLNSLYEPMRPYGGTAWIAGDERTRTTIARALRDSGLHGAAADMVDGALIVRREGPLPGSAQWTHNLGDITNTAKSDDDRVKLPLGLLWFGGNSNADVLPRHGHGPAEQVIGGRLFIEGMNSLTARDVYTGRDLWTKTLLDLDTYNVYYDHTYKDAPTSTRYNQVHIPGANIRGTNYIATEDLVYVIQGAECHALDAETGETKKVLRLPPEDPDAERTVHPEWGYIGVYGDLLIGGSGFVAFSDLLDITRDEYSNWKDFDLSASAGLVVMDRHTGDVLWECDARHGFLHNAVTAGDGVLYFLDKLPPLVEERLSRRGEESPGGYRLSARDIRTGSAAWEDTTNVFGSFLSYSAEHELLVQSTRPSRDTVGGENGKRMIVYRAQDGDVIWDREISYRTFPILHGDRIVTESGIFDLLSGDTVHRENPLTGDHIPWTWKRMYGCNFPMASEHLLTFRSGAAGFYDFTNAGGTGNFGGFKSGCTNTIVAADGVLNIPDYTRTCNCAYQNQASVALVYMPDADIETWTYDTITWDGSPVERIGVNLGAPGDHLADDGTLWLDIPVVGGDSPDIPVSIEPSEEIVWYRRHISRVTGDGPRLVAASGGEGISRMTVPLSAEPTGGRLLTVRLHFCEPDENAKPGSRVFDVAVQGKSAVSGLDIVKEAGGSFRPLVREINGVRADTELVVELSVSRGTPVISGIEIVAEGKTAVR